MFRPPDPQLLGFLEAYDPTIASIVLGLREIVIEEAPDTDESIYQVSYTMAIWFGFGPKSKNSFCYITAHKQHVNLGFPYGADLPDPNKVLIGEGKTMRHIKFESNRDLARAFVRRYIQGAIGQVETDGASGRTVVKPTQALGNKPAVKKRPRMRKP